MTDDELMSREQVAALLGGISPESVRSWARRQKPPVRFGYSRADVEAAIARRTGQGRRTDLEKAAAKPIAEAITTMRDQLAAIHQQPKDTATMCTSDEWCNCQSLDDTGPWHPAGDTPSCPKPDDRGA